MAQPDNKLDKDYELEAQAKAAANLIRHKIDAIYDQEPDAVTEALDSMGFGGSAQISRHQLFIQELIASGKSLPKIQAAWHEYYAALPDEQKHQIWQEFYEAHAKASRYAKAAAPDGGLEIEPSPPVITKSSLASRQPAWRQTLAKAAGSARSTLKASAALSGRQRAKSLVFGLAIGGAVLILFLFSFFNERFIAPFIQPSRVATNAPIINDNSAGSGNPEIIIPKINVEIPVVYGVSSIEEDVMQDALQNGVLHYADTALPGENGNIVIVGHSSNNIFNKGRYKFAFVLLNRLENGDTFTLTRDGKRYVYQVFKKAVVKPTDLAVLSPGTKVATAALVTCDPPGTSINRLVIIGEQISPAPTGNTAQRTTNQLAEQARIIPGNAPSLWHRLTGWITR